MIKGMKEMMKDGCEDKEESSKEGSDRMNIKMDLLDKIKKMAMEHMPLGEDSKVEGEIIVAELDGEGGDSPKDAHREAPMDPKEAKDDMIMDLKKEVQELKEELAKLKGEDEEEIEDNVQI